MQCARSDEFVIADAVLARKLGSVRPVNDHRMEAQILPPLLGVIIRADGGDGTRFIAEHAALHDDIAIEHILEQRTGSGGAEHTSVHEPDTTVAAAPVQDVDPLKFGRQRLALPLRQNRNGPRNLQAAGRPVGDDR
ncbi:hypothetical protein D3C81_1752860 [compost metagenome]